MKEKDYKKLKKVLNDHRKEAYVSCSEDCWCWELEKELYSAINLRKRDSMSVEKEGRKGGKKQWYI